MMTECFGRDRRFQLETRYQNLMSVIFDQCIHQLGSRKMVPQAAHQYHSSPNLIGKQKYEAERCVRGELGMSGESDLRVTSAVFL